MVALVRSNNRDTLDDEIVALPIYGQIRLWINGNPPTPTQLWIVVGDFALADSSRLTAIKSAHISTLDQKRDEILARAKRALSEFGVSRGQSFHMDIHVPQSLVNQY